VHGLEALSVLVGQGLLDLQTDETGEYAEACGGKAKRWRGAMVHPDQNWVIKASIHAGAVEGVYCTVRCIDKIKIL